MCINLPPKYAVSNVEGFLKGKKAIAITQRFISNQRIYTGDHFLTRKNFVSTVCLNEYVVREYIMHQ